MGLKNTSGYAPNGQVSGELQVRPVSQSSEPHLTGNSQTEDSEFRRNHSLKDGCDGGEGSRSDRLLRMNKVSKQISPGERKSFAARDSR